MTRDQPNAPRLRNYADAEAFLNGFLNYEKLLGTRAMTYDTKSFDLERFRALLRDMGDPHLAAPAIHVAGTKGKGSTCAFLRSALSACGLRAGLYTSPHLATYLERITVDGAPIPEARFCAILEDLARLSGAEAGRADGANNFRTVFELLTATAFAHFRAEGVDVAVVETGLGGRLDSTNVFDEPPHPPAAGHVAVITAIGLDHVAILGDTVERIAAEKAGILRPHGAAVLGVQPPAWAARVRKVVEDAARGCGAGTIVDADAAIAAEAVRVVRDSGALEIPARAAVDGGVPAMAVRLRLRDAPQAPGAPPHPPAALARALAGGMEFGTTMVGAHQADNLRTALAALLAFERQTGIALDPGAVAEGIRAARWPGRFEVVSRDPLVVVDGAHCPLSGAALGATFRRVYGDLPVVAVAGFMRDKAAVEIARAALGGWNVVSAVACAAPSPRGLSPTETAAILRHATDAPVHEEPDAASAVRRAVSLMPPGGAVVVFGSLFLVAPATETARNMIINHKDTKNTKKSQTP